MKQRWYDKNPTLSMAISLLQNASLTHQEMAARYMFKQLGQQNLLEQAELGTQENRIQFVFPGFRRKNFEMHARHLVELIKHLSPEHQEEVAIQLINYIYILDGELSDFPLPDADTTLSSTLTTPPESLSG